jgi:hypothetical protein
LLQIEDLVMRDLTKKSFLCLMQESREVVVDKRFQIGSPEEAETGFSLQLPEVSLGIDNAISYDKYLSTSNLSS